MYTVELSINIKGKLDIEEINSNFFSLLCSLRRNGQIIGKEYINSFNGEKLSYLVICLAKDSLSVSYCNTYVNKHWKELEALAKSKLTTKVLGKDLMANPECCGCNKQPYYILFTHFLMIDSPLRCGECFMTVPLYEIPKTDSDEYTSILSWESVYQACDTLQMNCTVGERFGLREMSNFESQLTQQGLNICKNIESLTHKPVFYYLYNYRKINLAKDKQRLCPSCGNPWLLTERLHDLFDFKCDNCRLLSSLTCNSSK